MKEKDRGRKEAEERRDRKDGGKEAHTDSDGERAEGCSTLHVQASTTIAV